MERVAIYARISTHDQHIESQLYPLRELAARRGFEIVQEYMDVGVSGSKARRRGLDTMLADAHRHKFSKILVAGFDRVARSVKHFLRVIDELNDLGIELFRLAKTLIRLVRWGGCSSPFSGASPNSNAH